MRIRKTLLFERLLLEADLTPKEAADIQREAENSKQQLETVTSAIPKVHNVKNNRSNQNKQNQDSDIFMCQKCGREHSKYNCQAFGKLCGKCKN